MRVNNVQTVNCAVLEKLVKLANIALNRAGELDKEGNILYTPKTTNELNNHTGVIKMFVTNKLRTKFKVEDVRR